MRLLPILLTLLLLAACAAPSQQAATGATPAAASGSTPTAAMPAAGTPAAGTPAAADAGADAPAAALPAVAQVDRSCRTDADCVVKDVGSCCGRFPACVNRDSPTDPAAVKARCEAEGRSAVCGFNEISACQCVRGQCADQREPVGGWIDDPALPPTPER